MRAFAVSYFQTLKLFTFLHIISVKRNKEPQINTASGEAQKIQMHGKLSY
jgi:hypothetical protein